MHRNVYGVSIFSTLCKHFLALEDSKGEVRANLSTTILIEQVIKQLIVTTHFVDTQFFKTMKFIKKTIFLQSRGLRIVHKFTKVDCLDIILSPIKKFSR